MIVCILDVKSNISCAANFKQGLESKCYYSCFQLEYLKQVLTRRKGVETTLNSALQRGISGKSKLV